jgi:acyl-coenzyme A thioesterase PaaI-like protein
MKLKFQAGDDGHVKAKLKGNFRLQGYEGILHGGVIAALLDAAMTHCLFHHGVQGVTGDLRVRFVQPVPCYATLDLTAWVLSTTPPLYRLRAEIMCETRVAAWAEAKFMQQGVSQ